MDAAGTVFEITLLGSVALSSALMMFVDRYNMNARDAQRIHMLMGGFTAFMLYLQIHPVHVMRYVVAVMGVPMVIKLMAYLFERTSVAMPVQREKAL